MTNTAPMVIRTFVIDSDFGFRISSFRKTCPHKRPHHNALRRQTSSPPGTLAGVQKQGAAPLSPAALLRQLARRMDRLFPREVVDLRSTRICRELLDPDRGDFLLRRCRRPHQAKALP